MEQKEQKLGGYTGKILRVNLSTNSITEEPTNEQICRKYLGGAGFVTYFLWKELPQGIEPLSPENKLIFALGPLTGIPLSGSGRNCVGAKSPLTGGIAKSEVGEFWGAELKRAGYDAVIIEGKAEKPVYLWIHDGEASIKDASHLWGKMTRETQQAVRDELGDKFIRLALIGPAGENLVSYACIMNGLFDAAGRGGLGAVMGSKNLKAVAVRGHKAPTIVNPEVVKALRDWLGENMRLVKDFHDFGTGAAMAGFEAAGNLPVRNFRDGLFPTVKTIDAQAVKDNIRVDMDACFACAVRCKKVVQVKEPYEVDSAYGGPEYETLASIGSNCGIDNLKAIAKGNELCSAYSLDTISTGAVISFAMECFEKGLLNTKDTGGIELKFGNTEAMLKVIELIGQRKGIGDLLAEGSARAALRIGRGAQQYAMQVKGLEAGMHEPRAKPGLGLGFMVNPMGADHCCNLHDSAYNVNNRPVREMVQLGMSAPLPVEEMGPRKVAMFKFIQLQRILCDCLVFCQFLPYDLQQDSDLVSAVTGWKTSVNELLRIPERVLTLARLFNIREGLTAADDNLPKRFFQPKTDGILADKPLNPADFERAKSYYYTLMGWDEHTGVPLPEKLVELEIT
ncbi:MAG: aldehyde ferredoxin oxidoreductase family protein [Chloroflexota bacterium]